MTLLDQGINYVFYEETYLSGGGGGFGVGLESRRIDSELWELLTRALVAALCSKICRSRGVSGMSGRELRCGVSSELYPEVLLIHKG